MSVLGYELDWFDSITGLHNKLFMKYFIEDGTIEILQENQKQFLKRIFYPEVKLKHLFLGSSITIYNRLMTITAYANSATTAYITSREVRFLYSLAKNDLNRIGDLLILARQYDLRVNRAMTVSAASASSFASTSKSFGSSGGGGLAGAGSNELFVEPGDSLIEIVGFSKKDAAGFQEEVEKLGLQFSYMPATADDVLGIFETSKSVCVIRNCTLCLVKPHLLKSEKAGELLNAITKESFSIEAINSIHMTLPVAEELFDVYRGVFSRYSDMMTELTSGPALAVMISSPSFSSSEEAVEAFREFTGPVNPNLGKILRPYSLRANFGENIIQNAVHCTDLATDGVMECKYFFETLPSM